VSGKRLNGLVVQFVEGGGKAAEMLSDKVCCVELVGGSGFGFFFSCSCDSIQSVSCVDVGWGCRWWFAVMGLYKVNWCC